MKEYIEERAIAIANYIIDGETDSKTVWNFEKYGAQGCD